jgi:hypothetical protein
MSKQCQMYYKVPSYYHFSLLTRNYFPFLVQVVLLGRDSYIDASNYQCSPLKSILRFSSRLRRRKSSGTTTSYRKCCSNTNCCIIVLGCVRYKRLGSWVSNSVKTADHPHSFPCWLESRHLLVHHLFLPADSFSFLWRLPHLAVTTMSVEITE